LRVQRVENAQEQRRVAGRRLQRHEQDDLGRGRGLPFRLECVEAPFPRLFAELPVIVEASMHNGHLHQFFERARSARIRAAQHAEIAGELKQRLHHRIEERWIAKQRLDREDHAASVDVAQLVPVKEAAADERSGGGRTIRIEPQDLLVRRMPGREARWRIRIERALDHFLKCRFVSRVFPRLRIDEEEREPHRHHGREHASEDPLTHR